MRLDIAKKLITVLLIILIITLALTLFLLSKTENNENPADSEPQESNTTDSEPPASSSDTIGSVDTPPADTTDPEDTTNPPPFTEPPVTTPPVTEPPVTNPPQTDEDRDPAPSGFSLEKVFTSDTGTRLNLRMECVAKENRDGRITMTVNLYLEHNSLQMGKRTGCRLSVGNLSETFTTDPIRQEEAKNTATLLHSISGIFSYGESVELYAKMPVRLSNYAGVAIEILEIDTRITLT